MKPDLLLMSPMLDRTERSLDTLYEVHRPFAADDEDAFLNRLRSKSGPSPAGARFDCLAS